MNQNLPAQPLFRRAFAVSTLTLTLGAAVALAQSSSGTGQRPTTDRTSPSTTPADQPRRSTEPSISADAKSTRDINAAAGTTTHEKLSWGDRRFINKTADAGMAEVQIAQLAVQKATDPAVRAFAQKLIDQHTKINSDLATLASEKGVMLDKDDGKDRAYNRLNRQTGAEFDQEFVEHMVEQHEDSIKRFEKASTNAKDMGVRSFASMQVNELRQHLLEAQALQSSVVAAGAGRQRSRSGSLSSPSGSYDTTPAGPTTTPSATRPTDPSGTTTPSTPKRDNSR
jgi:putative membrane protein